MARRIKEPSGPPREDAVAVTIGVYSTGDVVSLTIQLPAPGAGRAGAMLRDRLSRHSSRSSRSIREQARRSAIESLAPCARAILLATSNAMDRGIAFIAIPALRAPDDPAIPAPPQSGRGREPSRRD